MVALHSAIDGRPSLRERVECWSPFAPAKECHYGGRHSFAERKATMSSTSSQDASRQRGMAAFLGRHSLAERKATMAIMFTSGVANARSFVGHPLRIACSTVKSRFDSSTQTVAWDRMRGCPLSRRLAVVVANQSKVLPPPLVSRQLLGIKPKQALMLRRCFFHTACPAKHEWVQPTESAHHSAPVGIRGSCKQSR